MTKPFPSEKIFCAKNDRGKGLLSQESENDEVSSKLGELHENFLTQKIPLFIRSMITIAKM